MLSRHAIPVGRILGIPIDLDPSWFLVFALLTWTLAVGYYPAEFKDWPVMEYWIVGAITACCLYGSVLLHELGHSVVARRYGIPVRRITLFIFGGVAQIASEPPSPRAEFWVAIAGPVVSILLATGFHLAEPALPSGSALLALAKYLAYINGVLVLFNLIPGFPLDGGRIFRALVWGFTRNLRRATVVAGNVGRFIGFLFILTGVWKILGGNLINGMWIAFIGWFLESAALAQIQLQTVHALLAGHTVAESMIPLSRMKWVRPDTDLEAALKEMERDGMQQVPVMADGQVVGMLTRSDLLNFLRTLQPLNGGRWSPAR